MPRLRRIVLAVGIGLVALEAALQIGALVVTFTASGPGGPAADVPTVLCIGDSYTYGFGASSSDQSYPAQLGRLLAKRLPLAPVVVNAGWPGQNSREALLHLPQQLAVNRPQVVCVLIGLNDSWTHPQPVGSGALGAEQPGRWQWRWRTWRLLQVLWGSGGKVAPPSAASSPEPVATGTKAFLQQVVARIKAGQHGAAMTMLERALVDDPHNAAEYHLGIVQVQMALGQRAKAETSLLWLRREFEQRPTQQVAESCASALYAAGERQQAAVVARAAVPRFPDCSSLWWVSGQGYYDAGDLAAAERELDRAVATAGGSDAAWRATVNRDCARAACGRDLQKALRLLVVALQLDGDVERCRLVVAGAPEVFTADAVRRAVQELRLDPADLERLQGVFTKGGNERSRMCAVLRQHLQQVVATCREHDARVVLLTYPMAVDDVEAVYGEVAGQLAVPLARCWPRFAAELQQRTREELYIRDGHCTDAGYALMAEVALEPVLRELQR